MDTVLITGASSGIGYAVAQKFLRQGASVINISRTECVLCGVKNYLCDLSDNNALALTCDRLLRENPSIDALIYSAGFSMAAPLEYVEEEDYRYLFDVNFFGFVYLLKRLLPTLRHSGGVAVAVGSLAADTTIPFDSYYVASKAALNAFVSSLHAELTPKNVRVAVLMPGGTKTNFTYKRKIYPADRVGDYKYPVNLATKNLAHIEQNGQDVENVAEKIVSLCFRTNPSGAYTSGFLNKITRLFLKITPKFIKNALIESVFFSQE